MTDYRGILMLSSLSLNRTQIADSLGVSRTTVIYVLQRVAAQSLDWQTVETLSDRELTSKLYPNGSHSPDYHMPDYDYIHKEMAKPGMTQQLPWMEYYDKCRDSGKIPYQRCSGGTDSVPFEYIKRNVDARITRNTIEVFVDGVRLCSHIRLYGRRGQHSTSESHMPPNHQQYVKWSGERFRKWAFKIGQSTITVVESILTGCKAEQQGHRTCLKRKYV